MPDPYSKTPNTVENPAKNAFAVTPDNNNDLAITPKSIYVGNTGNVVCVMAGEAANTSVTFVGVPAGTTLRIRVRRIISTGTTATNILGLY